MKFIKKFTYKLFRKLGHMGLLNWVNDEAYIKVLYKMQNGINLNLDTPKSLNEKLQWLKLHDHKSEYTMMADKYAVKKYISEILGEEYIIPTLGVWDSFDEIDFNSLPNQFVLKCTHDSGSILKCQDKGLFDKKKAAKYFNKKLKHNYYWDSREWPYKNIKPKILAEPLLKNHDGSPIADYKFYCFGREPQYFMYSLGEAEHNVRNHKFNLDLQSIDYLFKEKPTINENEIHLPFNINQMIEFSKILSKDMEHIRVDFYNINGKIYFGELTFYSGSGIINILSDEYSSYLADLIKCK